MQAVSFYCQLFQQFQVTDLSDQYGELIKVQFQDS